MTPTKSKHSAHSQHSTFLKNNSDSEQHGNYIGFQTARNRSPSCSSNHSLRSVDGCLESTSKVSKFSNISSTKQGLCKIIIRTLLLVLLYYLSSIGLTFYQKWLMKVIIPTVLFVIFAVILTFFILFLYRNFIILYQL